VTGRTVYHLLGDNLPRNAARTALVDAGRRATYAELGVEANRVAAWLWSCGIQPGDRVIVHLRKGIDEVAAMFGAWKIGAVVVNVNSQWTAAQLSYVAADCRARAAIVGRTVPPGLATTPGSHLVSDVLMQGAPATLGGVAPWENLPTDRVAPEVV
jgi:acyl-CoA synthetase (AMP-forming)/AMP-acid ligase II